MNKFLKISVVLIPVLLMCFCGVVTAGSLSPPLYGRLLEQTDSTDVKNTEGWTLRRLNKVLEEETGGAMMEDQGWEQKKDSRVAMLCALVFPGLGQMYNEKPYKAILAMGLETFYLSNILFKYREEARSRKLRDSQEKYNSEGVLNSEWNYHDYWYNEYKEQKIDWVWWSAGLLVVLIFDAYVDAHLHDMNFQAGGNGGLTLSFDF